MKNTLLNDLLKSSTQLSTLVRGYSSLAMSPWQTLGFLVGSACGGISTEVLDPEDHQWLVGEFLDELARADDEDEPTGFEDGPSEECVAALAEPVLTLYKSIESALETGEGEMEFPFAEELEKADAKARNAILAQAREFCSGLLRGIPFAVEDDEELETDAWGEVLGLLFILTEDDLGPDFGSAEEVLQARLSVASGLQGITSQLFALGLGE